MGATMQAYKAPDRDGVRSVADRLCTGVATWRDATKATDAVRGCVDSAVVVAAEKDAGVLFVADASFVNAGFVPVTQRARWAGELDAYVGELVVRADHESHGVPATSSLSAVEDVTAPFAVEPTPRVSG